MPKMARGVNKNAVRLRLQASGHWGQAVKFRDGLKRDGVPAIEAWEQMAAKFLPMSEAWEKAHPAETQAVAAGMTPKGAKQAAKARRGRVRPNLLDEAHWIYLNLSNPEPAEPPSDGTMFALKSYQKEPGKFLEMYFSRLLPSRAQVESEGSRADNDKPLDRLIDDIANALSEAKSVLEGAEDGDGEHEVPEAPGGGGSQECPSPIGPVDGV